MKNLTTTSDINQNWSSFQKTAFCFCFIFFSLLLLPFPIGDIPVVGEYIKEPYDNAWDKLINWTGKILFGIPEITVRPNGSGDTTWSWVQVFLIVVFSAIGCLIWRILDRKRLNYNNLDFGSSIYFRYFLVINMLTYGIVKIFPSQFGTIDNYNMYQQVGDMSPMRLLWIFMAYSTKYQFFAGAMECLAGILLVFRRTKTLGALIALGVMTNVFAMNMCFDVPVKIFSFSLILISLYLLKNDFQRLINFFILQKPTTAPPQYQPAFAEKKGFTIGRIVLKTLFLLGLLIPIVMQIMEDDDADKKELSSFYGRYAVAKHLKNNLNVSIVDTLHWDRLLIDNQYSKDVMIASNDMGLRSRMTFERNDTTKTMQVSLPKDSVKYAFTYQQSDTTRLILSGKLGKDSVHIELLKQPKKEFLLVKRGFRWVNEYPFNR